MFNKSQLVTQRPAGRSGVYWVEPVLSEREFTRWLTLANREIPGGDQDDIADRVSAYDGALLDEFFATLPERTAFWVRAREEELVKNRARFGDEGDRRVGTTEIAFYIERLEWVVGRENDPGFLALNGHQRLHVVAIALCYGVDSARRFWQGSSQCWDDDDLQAVFEARQELEFLIYQQRGLAVEFVPTRDVATVEETLVRDPKPRPQ